MTRLLGVVFQSLAVVSLADKGVPAVQKVIQMLGDMQVKGKAEKQAEEVAFAEFQTWCKMESAELTKEIGQNAVTIEGLTTSIGKLDSDIGTLGQDIGALQTEVGQHGADKQAATEQREEDHAAFVEEEKDYSESVDAIYRAITVLKKENYDRPASAAALLQLTNSDQLSQKARVQLSRAADLVAAFLGKDSPLGGMGHQAPEANGYEFQSTGIVELLQRLQDDFRGKLGECQKAEMNSQHATDMIVADLEDSTDNKNRAVEEKSAEKARKTEQKAIDEKQLSSTQSLKASNEQTLKEMSMECEEKSMSFQEKQQLRAEEIEAIGKAIEILSSPDVLGNTEKHPSMAQISGRKTALVQLRGGEEQAAKTQGVHRRVREFLEHEGERLRSSQLTLLAEKMAADPFAKVKNMIDAMITRLLEEANQDAQHEGFCDTEMGKNKIQRTKLTEDIDALNAAIDNGKATILRLTEEAAALNKDVQDLDQAMAESTNLRTAEKAKNKETVDDAVAGQRAVAAATAVLKDFYTKAATATAFVQLSKKADPKAFGIKSGIRMGTQEWNALGNPQNEIGVAGVQGSVDTGHSEGMQTFGEQDQGQQDEASYGVLSLLEIIQSDFSILQADTEAAETAAAQSYERFMAEANRNKATKVKKIEMDEADRTSAESKMQADTADLKATQDELLAADRYHEKLVPQCMDQGMTFEERTAARQAEINSLKDALKLLESSDVATSS